MKVEMDSLRDIINQQSTHINKIENITKKQSKQLDQTQNITLQSIRTELAKIKQDMKTINECQDKINIMQEKINTMDINHDGLKNDLNVLKNKSPEDADSTGVVKSGLHLVIYFCVLILAVMGYFIYKHENHILTISDDANVRCDNQGILCIHTYISANSNLIYTGIQ